MTAVPIRFLDGASIEGMTPEARALLPAMAEAAAAAGLTELQVIAGKADTGHVSHYAGTEFDIVGVQANGQRWTQDQRVAVATGARRAGANRFGFYSAANGSFNGNSLHVGLGPNGQNQNTTWGFRGETGGDGSRAFTHAGERDFSAAVAGGAPVPPQTIPPTGGGRQSVEALTFGTGEVRRLQRFLNGRGAGLKINGEMDGATATALRSYQTTTGIPATGTVDEATLGAIAGHAAVAGSPMPFTGQVRGFVQTRIDAMHDNIEARQRGEFPILDKIRAFLTRRRAIRAEREAGGTPTLDNVQDWLERRRERRGGQPATNVVPPPAPPLGQNNPVTGATAPAPSATARPMAAPGPDSFTISPPPPPVPANQDRDAAGVAARAMPAPPLGDQPKAVPGEAATAARLFGGGAIAASPTIAEVPAEPAAPPPPPTAVDPAARTAFDMMFGGLGGRPAPVAAPPPPPVVGELQNPDDTFTPFSGRPTGPPSAAGLAADGANAAEENPFTSPPVIRADGQPSRMAPPPVPPVGGVPSTDPYVDLNAGSPPARDDSGAVNVEQPRGPSPYGRAGAAAAFRASSGQMGGMLPQSPVQPAYMPPNPSPPPPGRLVTPLPGAPPAPQRGYVGNTNGQSAPFNPPEPPSLGTSGRVEGPPPPPKPAAPPPPPTAAAPAARTAFDMMFGGLGGRPAPVAASPPPGRSPIPTGMITLPRDPSYGPGPGVVAPSAGAERLRLQPPVNLRRPDAAQAAMPELLRLLAKKLGIGMGL